MGEERKEGERREKRKQEARYLLCFTFAAVAIIASVQSLALHDPPNTSRGYS